MRLSLLAVGLAVGFSAAAAGGAAESQYLFVDFERTGGWKPGPLETKKSSFTLAQGQAEIVPVPEDGGQALELRPSDPFAAVMLDATPLADRSIVYCETFVRPVALDESASDEFLDFGGAVVGFFRNGNEGELCALSSKSPEESVWISSGVRFPLAEDGTAKQAMRVTIRLNQKARRWDLAINGQAVLAGLAAVPRPRVLRLWLYGDRSRPVQFDDVLVSNRAPDELEREFPREQVIRRQQTPAPQGKPGRQVVMKEKANAGLREASKPLQAVRGKVILEDWHVSLKSGDRVYNEATGGNEDDLKIIAYALAHDDAGNPLPVTVTITADASLEPGADLADLRWGIDELLGLDDDMKPKTGVTIVEGDFRTGLVQTVEIPAEWARKATSVWFSTVESDR